MYEKRAALVAPAAPVAGSLKRLFDLDEGRHVVVEADNKSNDSATSENAVS
jgi:hypothetical protein